MPEINYQWISGSIPRNIMQQNIDSYLSFCTSMNEEDGFIHLIGKMTSVYPMQGTMNYFVNVPYQFFYVYEGTLCLSLHDCIYEIPEGYVALLPADGITMLQIKKARCRFLHIYLSGLALNKFYHALHEPFYYPTESSSLFSLSGFLHHMEMLTPQEADFLFLSKTSMWITELLTEMVLFRAQPETKKEAPPKYITEIHDLFEAHYNDNYRLEDLENRYSISRYRICREFTKHYAQSPMQYLNHVRIENAKKLLLTTDISIHEIGAMVGITNTNHFINLFKRETGATPLAYKQDAPVSISELHYL